MPLTEEITSHQLTAQNEPAADVLAEVIRGLQIEAIVTRADGTIDAAHAWILASLLLELPDNPAGRGENDDARD